VFTAIERRHLMTWSIFAPKLAFELAIAMFVTLLCLLVVELHRRLGCAAVDVSSYSSRLD
jgi:hypothetical protein